MAVTTTAHAVQAGSSAQTARGTRAGSSTASTTAVQVAQARCSEGIAAYWSAGTGPPWVTPKPASATEST